MAHRWQGGGVVVLLLVALTDGLVTPLGFAHGLLYVVVLWMARRSGSLLALDAFALGAFLLTVALAMLLHWPEDTLMVLANRSLTLAVLVGAWLALRSALRDELHDSLLLGALSGVGIGAMFYSPEGDLQRANPHARDLFAGAPPADLQALGVDGVRADGDVVPEAIDLDPSPDGPPLRLLLMPHAEGALARGTLVVVVQRPLLAPPDALRVLEALDEGVITVDPEGRVRLINGAARRLLGVHEGEEPVGRPLWDVVAQQLQTPLRLHCVAARDGQVYGRQILQAPGWPWPFAIDVLARADGSTVLLHRAVAAPDQPNTVPLVRADRLDGATHALIEQFTVITGCVDLLGGDHGERYRARLLALLQEAVAAAAVPVHALRDTMDRR